jgi:hypothetical protein
MYKKYGEGWGYHHPDHEEEFEAWLERKQEGEW